MKKLTTLSVAFVLCASLAACNRAESPAEVSNDVAKAQTEANKDVAEARHDAAKDLQADVADVRDDVQEASKTSAQGAHDVAIIKAEGDHKVAIEKCEGLKGDLQKACKDTADAGLETAKAQAKAQLAQATDR